ncbi:MAG: Methane monooxygenase component alpha chain [Conexibacter sp.]|jgi:propane 2-monooxygenase large subunit|nr:Methane monooxygenase component alpha chain [Conexibacter sp.]
MAIAAPRRRSISASHARVRELGWTPTYFESEPRYPTRYKIPRTTGRDPMRQIMGDYLNMQLEKDDRVFGGLDAGVRAGLPNTAPLRFHEAIKPFVTNIAGGEAGALRCMSLLIDAIPDNELRNAYYVQMLDEQRHTGLMMALYRWYTKHLSEPVGWNAGHRATGRSFVNMGGFNIFGQFMTGDPIQAAVCTQVVIETGFTNTIAVALPDVAARNGDFAMPTMMNSIQSDEARHINNGYATLLYLLQEPENIPRLEQDITQMYWVSHCNVDTGVGVLCEYATKDRSEEESWLEKFDRWMMEDYYRSYVSNLSKLGINISEDIFKRARQRIVDGQCHAAAIGAYSYWPFQWFKQDALDERDFEWFENKYPGWYARWGRFWEELRHAKYPDERKIVGGLALEEAGALCWTCQNGCYHKEDRRHRVVDDYTRFYCSPECKWIDETNPGRYIGDRMWEEYYHGWEYSEIVRDLGYVRPDGKTLMGQPHVELDPAKQWTLDDIKACGDHMESNNFLMAQKMGLPWKPRPHGFFDAKNGNGTNIVIPSAEDAIQHTSSWRSGNGSHWSPEQWEQTLAAHG